MFQTFRRHAAAAALGSAAFVAMRRRVFVTKMAFGLMTAAALVAVAGAVVFAFQQHASAERRQMRKTYELLRSITRLEAIVTHAESGQRGFILTLDPKYLAQFTVASEKLPHEIEMLEALIADDPVAHTQGKLLITTVGEKFAELRMTLAMQPSKNRDAVIAAIENDKGLGLAAKIYALCESLRHEEQGRLLALIQNDERSNSRIALATGGLLALAVLAILIASWRSSREHVRRAEAHRELEKRNGMLALAGEIADIGHWTLDVATSAMWWSDQTFRIHGIEPGRSAEVPTLARAIDFYGPEDRARVAALIARGMETGEGFQFEARLVRADATSVNVMSRAICARDEDGKVVSVFGVLMDVTAIRASERDTADSNAMFKLAGEIADLGHWRVSVPSNQVYWSDQVFRIHGLDPSIGQPTLEQAGSFFTPKEFERITASMRHAAETGEGFLFETKLRRKDGTELDVISRGICDKDADGNVTSLFGVLQDVSAMRRSERSLRKSEHLYRVLAENVTDVLVKYDAASRFTFVSPSSERLLGRTPGSLVGTYLADLVHPEDCESVVAQLSAWEPNAGSVHAGIEFRLAHAEGSWIWVEANACRVLEADGSDGSTAVIRDFRQRKQVQDRLAAAMESAEAARRQAESANQAKSDFLAAMSHEIRTPLNSIVGFTGLMLDSKALNGALRHQAEIVRSSGEALLTVINDILDFSKIEAGKIEIEQVPFLPRALFANALSIVRGTAISKSLDITANIDPALPEGLLGDQARIQQVLLNLLNNAVKFTAQGSVTLNVRVEKDDIETTRLRLSVVDTGVGISKLKQDRLFKRFSQADASVSRQYGGSGLGLAICKRLVELMGGEIGVFSDEGHGSNFWFTLTLPRARLVLSATAASAGEARKTGRLLLVEDIEVNQMLARTLLEADGHKVDIVSSGEAAIEAVQSKRYDIVLMDVQMPGIGGVAATQLVRTLSGCEKLPIIAMTANVLTEQVREFREAGMDDHVGKPINRAELRATLARWLDAKPPTEDDSALFDRSTFYAIADLLGPDKTMESLSKFLRELEHRLAAEHLGEPSRQTFQHDAHVVTSIAGMLGFTDLAQRCAAIVMTKLDDPAFELKGVALLRAKDQAMTRLRGLTGGHAEAVAAA